MTPEEERFNELLAQLENSDRYPLATAFAETPADHLLPLDIEIWIMKSEDLFYEGRLKGSRKVTAGRWKEYNSYPINDLKTLVREAASALFSWLGYKKFKYTDCEGPTESVTGLFDRLFQSYDAMAERVSFMRLSKETTIKETTISATRKVIEGWKIRVLKNIKPWIDESDIKNDLAKLFITHVPEAPPLRIAKCVRELLSRPPFDVDVNIDTFRKEVKKLKEYIEFDNISLI